MRFDRDRIIFLALLVLDDACNQCKKGPVQPAFSVRLALGCLYALGDGERELFQAFWNEIRQEHYPGSTPEQAAYLRSTYSRTHATGIARSVGVTFSIDYCQRMAKAKAGRQRDAPNPP